MDTQLEWVPSNPEVDVRVVFIGGFSVRAKEGVDGVIHGLIAELLLLSS